MVEVLVLLEGLDGQINVHLDQTPEQRAHELHAADLAEQLGDEGLDAEIAAGHGDLVVARADLDVARVLQVVDVTHVVLVRDGERGGELQDALEEDDELVRGPPLDVQPGGPESLRRVRVEFLPLVGQLVRGVGQRRVEIRLRRVARRVEPGVPVDLRELGRHVLVRGEEVQQRRLEVVAVERLAAPRLEVVRDEPVELLLGDELLDVVEEVEPLFVWDGREGVVRVFPLQVDDQLGEFVLGPELLDAVAHRFPADDGREVAPLVAAVDDGLDAPLQVRRPAFVEPEVLPRCVRDQVARPRMAEFVRDHVHVLAVARDDGRRRKCVDWVLHSAIWEGRWED